MQECLFFSRQQEVKEDQRALLSQAHNSMKAVLGVQKVFMALQVWLVVDHYLHCRKFPDGLIGSLVIIDE